MNNVELMGRLTRDPMQGNGVVTMTLAVDRHDKNKGTDYPTIKVFGKQADNVYKYLKQGSQCAVEGRLETGSYKNKKGETVYFTDVVANRVEFIGGAPKPAENAEQPVQEQIDGFDVIDEDVPW